MNILESGNEYRFFNQLNLISELPKGVYVFDCDRSGPHLRKVEEEVKIPDKVYKNDADFIEHVMYGWEHSDSSLGILLTGKKGLGKSFTANLFCTKLDMPVIKITREICKEEGLVDFLNGIKQDHILYIDEFEKIFTSADKAEDNRLNQKVFLSFLDGGNTSDVRRLFLITTNEQINDFFINRPTRLRYVREYEYMDIDVIREIIEDRLNNKEYLEDLIEHVDQDSVNIDILIKIADEINLHDKPYSSFKEFFNYKATNNTFEVTGKVAGEEKLYAFENIDGYTLNQLKNRTKLGYHFGYDESGMGSNYVSWTSILNGPIRRVDEKHYELEAIMRMEANEGESTPPKKITLFISRKMNYLVL